MSRISEKAKDLTEKIRLGANVSLEDLDEVLNNFYGNPKTKESDEDSEPNENKKEDSMGGKPKLTDPLIAAELDMKYRELTGYDHKQIIKNLQASINVAGEIYGSQGNSAKTADKMKQLEKVKNEVINKGLYERNESGAIVRVSRDKVEELSRKQKPKIMEMLKSSKENETGASKAIETNGKGR